MGDDGYIWLIIACVIVEVCLTIVVLVRNAMYRHDKRLLDNYVPEHDELTGLYNAQHLYSIIEETMVEAKKLYCVIYMDIRNFKITNDIFGMKFGDKVLVEIAKWLSDTFIDDDIGCGRLNGDTFGIFMPYSKFNADVFTEGLSNFEVTYNGTPHQVIIHAGVYVIADPKMDAAAMFDRAHMALSTILNNYKTSVQIYDESLRCSLLEEQLLISGLQTALAENQIHPYLQPIMDVNGTIVGAEALARWDHPELGYLPPAKFIPAFEKNGSISEVDRHIWEEACRILNTWKQKYPHLFISINISSKDFYFMDVVNEIKYLVDKYEIKASQLRIEITETAMMANPDERIEIFETFRKAGFVVEMDDFGSGFSSLNMLKDVPVDVLKLDMNFLSTEENSKAVVIMKNVITMSNELNITSLTEGVETENQFEKLVSMGCSLFQGFLFAKPMPLNEFEEFLKQKTKSTIVKRENK